MKTKYVLMFFLVMSCTILMGANTTFASSKMNFSVLPILPNEQINATKGYYHFRIQPDRHYELSFEITNLSRTENVIMLEATNTLTSSKGGTYYTTKTEKENTRMTDLDYAIAKHISLPSTIKLAPNETRLIKLSVSSPPNIQKGTVLGGIKFHSKDQAPTQSDKGDQETQIQYEVINKLSYTLAVQMDFDQKDETLVTFSSPLNEVTPSRPHILLPIKNVNASIANSVEARYKVFDLNGNLLFENRFGPFNMAPKTEINYQIPWEYTEYKPGKFRLTMTTLVDGKEKQYEETFTVTSKDVSEYYELTQPKKPIASYSPWDNWFPAILIVFIGVIFGFFYGKKKQKP